MKASSANIWKGESWPTMKNDAMEYVRRCGKYQKYRAVFNASSSELGALTKWIEVEPLAMITLANAIKFFKKNIMSK